MPRRGTNIYKRKDGRWEARYVRSVDPDGRKRYASVYARNYREVRDKQYQCIQNIHLAEAGSPTMTLEKLMWTWLDSTQDKVKKSTYLKYESAIRNHLTDGIGQLQIKYITGATIDRFTAEKLRGDDAVSPKTVNDLLVIIGMAFSYAQQEYGVAKPYLRRVKEPQKQMRFLSVDEQKALEAYVMANMDVYALGILLTLYTGLRIGELCALQWSDIQNGTVTVDKSMHRIKSGAATVVEITSPKTPTSNRTIPLPEFLCDLLAQYRTDGPVLKTAQGKAVEPRLMQIKFKKISAACGLENVNFHALRHTFATRCIEVGFDVKTLSEILGHTDVKTTLNRYVHSSFMLKQENMQKLRSPIITG